MQQLDARIISFPLAASKYFHWLFGGLSAALAPAFTGGVPGPFILRKRRKLLTLDYNEQLVKYGYEVRADRETIVFDGNPYLLTAGKVVDIVNDMIIKLCTSPGNPYIRFTSDSAKNFTRGAYREFLRCCIVKKTHFDKGDPEVVITEPLASLRISG